MNETEPQYFTKFRLELNDKLDKRFDAHAEQIAHVSEEITGIKKELKEINTRLDGHAEQIAHVSEQNSEIIRSMSKKADTLYLDDLTVRTKKLEKVVFA
jgi:archaellum component FlaC